MASVKRHRTPLARTPHPRHRTLVNLPDNLRFYVLASAFCLSLLSASWLRLQIPSDQLFSIRVQQVFGFVALLYWYLALIISPLSRIFGKQGVMAQLLFARRAIGVSAAYFAFLHAGVAFWGQVGGWAGIALLPGRFKWSLGFGVVGLLILAAMAATSFDKVIKYMTFRRWKLLHRVGYLAGVLTLLHVWMIATHLGYYSIRMTFALMLIVLSWLEAFRVAGNLCRKYKSLKSREEIVMILIWAVCVALIFGTPAVVKNYHQERHSQTAGHGHE